MAPATTRSKSREIGENRDIVEDQDPLPAQTMGNKDHDRRVSRQLLTEVFVQHDSKPIKALVDSGASSTTRAFRRILIRKIYHYRSPK
eukprot:SAG11_NODE_737_length_7431_cov_7.438762_12_plen_88_part_00